MAFLLFLVFGVDRLFYCLIFAAIFIVQLLYDDVERKTHWETASSHCPMDKGVARLCTTRINSCAKIGPSYSRYMS